MQLILFSQPFDVAELATMEFQLVKHFFRSFCSEMAVQHGSLSDVMRSSLPNEKMIWRLIKAVLSRTVRDKVE